MIPNVTVLVQEVDKPNRKTKYDLISVYKDGKLINIDSQVPNKLFHKWVLDGNLFENITLIKPEANFKKSRFDFYIEANNRRIFVEVKGVTLEEKGVALFPGAPTQRGLKHIKELISSIDDGYEAYIVFIILMKDISCLKPNFLIHRAFGETLITGKEKGIKVIALDCEVTETSISIRDYVKVKLEVY